MRGIAFDIYRALCDMRVGLQPHMLSRSLDSDRGQVLDGRVSRDTWTLKRIMAVCTRV